MNQSNAHNGVLSHSWLQHHVPWLGLLAMVLTLFRDDVEMGFDPDDMNG